MFLAYFDRFNVVLRQRKTGDDCSSPVFGSKRKGHNNPTEFELPAECKRPAVAIVWTAIAVMAIPIIAVRTRYALAAQNLAGMGAYNQFHGATATIGAGKIFVVVVIDIVHIAESLVI